MKMHFSLSLGNILFLPLIGVFITACTGRVNQNSRLGDSDNDTMQLQGERLFDGNTLNDWEITDFGTQGPVYVSRSSIILSMGDGCTGITWSGDFPQTDYEITLEAKRVDGNDFFCGMTFPAGDSPCSLIIGGWGGAVVGLSSIDGLDASENETSRLMSFIKDKWYLVKLRVAGDSIKAWIDNDQVVNISTTGRFISIRPEVELSKPFGIASWRTTAAIRNIRMRRL